MASDEIVKALRVEDPRVDVASLCWFNGTPFELDGRPYRVLQVQIVRANDEEWCVVLGLEAWA